MRIGIYLSKRATGDHGEIDFARLADGRALNGTEAAALNLARGLAERGHEVHVFCPAATQNSVAAELGGARVWWTQEPIIRGLDVHVAVSDPGILGRIPSDDHGFRVAWHHLIDFPDPYDPVVVDGWVFVSPMHLAAVTEHAELIRATWLPNATDFVATDAPRRPHTLAWISSPDRGLHRLLELWPRIRARVPTASLRIYYRLDPWLDMWAGREGDSPFIERANYIKQALDILGRNGENGVTVMGAVSRRQFMVELSQTACVPYTYEPIDPMSELFCIAGVDACAAGAVLIVSDADVLADHFLGVAEIIPGRPGDSPASWTTAICQALTDAEWVEPRRAEGRAFAAGLGHSHVAAAWERYLASRGKHGGPVSLMAFAHERPVPFEPVPRIEVAKPKLVYVFGQPEPSTWRDGMWAAMKLLEADFEITWVNAQLGEAPPAEGNHILLAWGDFESPAERACRHLKARRKALQMGGMSAPTTPALFWDVIFAETAWHQQYLRQHTGHGNVLRAFGVNTDIYRPDLDVQASPVFDWITVGHWADWKRQHLFHGKPGHKLAVGERYATANPHQAPPIIEAHLRAGVVVAPYVEPWQLARFYNMSARCYIPASLVGGGERAVLEAKACGIPVEIEPDNPKLQELLDGPVISHVDFARALKEGLR
jgi:glycosyltransferase involved in cell wall biosynthesis